MVRRRIAGLFLAALCIATTTPALATVNRLVRTNQNVLGSNTDWTNATSVTGAPGTDCNTNINPHYASNDVQASAEYLEVGGWSPITLAPGFVISSVFVDVNGRYDNPSSHDSLGMRVRGPAGSLPVPNTLLSTPEWNQSDFACDFRMGGDGWDVSRLHVGPWASADVESLRLAARRFDVPANPLPNRARVNGFQIVVVTTDAQSLVVSPNPVAFGAVTPGGTKDLEFTIRNAGVGTIAGTVAGSVPDAAFTVLSGAGPFSLTTNQFVTVTVRFHPLDSNVHDALLDLGNTFVPNVELIGNPCASVTIPGGTTVAAGDLTYDGKDVLVDGGTVTIDGAHTFCRLTVRNGAVVTHAAGDTLGMWLTVQTRCDVDATSRISGDFRGFSGGTGPGVPAGGSTSGYYAGGSYGGEGGNGGGQVSSGSTYGSLEQPTSFGSGGGRNVVGGAGGGALRLTVGGVLHVDGQVSADGQKGPINGDGGGSGGSLWIETGAFEGAGSVHANGGDGSNLTAGGAGGGGGGRIRIGYGTSTFSGALLADGGLGGDQAGGGGTVVTKPGVGRETIAISNAGRGLAAARTPMRGYPVTYDANVAVRAGGVLAPPLADSLWLSVGGSVTVESGSFISADFRGFAGAAGPGVPAGGSSNGYFAGASYGGEGSFGSGQVSSLSTYGSVEQPTSLGSGGGRNGVGGAGGGALRLSVGGVLHVDGQLSADGHKGPINGDGGGSGGSLWIETGTFEGAGSVHANGGDGSNLTAGGSGGGGGGRIRIGYGTSTFAGALLADGGLGGDQAGGGGTVVTKPGVGRETIAISNAGRGLAAARTPMRGYPVIYDANVVVRAGGVLAPPLADSLWLSVGGSVTVESNSFISADFRGFAGAAGPGAPVGGSTNGYFAGGSHGGEGGNASGQASLKSTFGSLQQPTSLGSGGGRNGVGGAGGGALRLTVGGVLHVDGQLSADGQKGPINGDGGGSGGSLWIETGTFEGAGSVHANGGSGSDVTAAGGGGGGRIAIYTYCWPNFALPQVSVAGGLGFRNGKPGTIYPNVGLTGIAAGVVATTGAVRKIKPQDSFVLGALESNDSLWVSVERGSALPPPSARVQLEITQPGTVTSAAQFTPALTDTGTYMNSHILHFDPIGSGSGAVRGSVTFDTNVLGIIVTTAGLAASDAQLHAPGASYSTALPARGAEFAGGADQDTVVLSADLRTVTFAAHVSSGMDEIRVVTAVPVGSCGAVSVPPIDPEQPVIPRELSFAPPSPNPAHGRTTLRYALPHVGRVSLDIYDIGGRRIASLVDREVGPGVYSQTWDGTGRDGARREAGVYFARLITLDGTRTQRITLIE